MSKLGQYITKTKPGKWYILLEEKVKKDNQGHAQNKYECKLCGNIIIKHKHNASRHKRCSKKCYYYQALLDIENKTEYNRLIIIDIYIDEYKQVVCKCLCNCGNTTLMQYSRLTSRNTKSCGCLFKESIIGNSNPSWTGGKHVPGWYYNKMQRKYLGKKAHNVSVSIDYIDKLFCVQNKKCALTGIELSFGKNLKKVTASLDRIDSSKGYIEGNLQWVHKDINNMKQLHTQEKFIKLCIMVAEHNKKVKND